MRSMCASWFGGRRAATRTARSFTIHRPRAGCSFASVAHARLSIFHASRDRLSSAKSPNGEKLRSKSIETRGGGWGLVASVIFKITVTLLRRVGWVRFPHSPATVLVAAVLCAAPFCPQSARAQQRDSARAGIAAPARQATQPTAPDTTPKPPMSPRRAFLTSLLIPGYAQTVFGRDRAAML